jgi:hypothetical protein
MRAHRDVQRSEQQQSGCGSRDSGYAFTRPGGDPAQLHLPHAGRVARAAADPAAARRRRRWSPGGLARARLRRSGWASGSQFEATGFVRSSLSGAIPDLQLHALYWVW